MTRQSPGDEIPTAEAVRVTGNALRRSMVLMFKTPTTPTAVEIPLSLLPHLISELAQGLAQGDGAADIRHAAQMFAIREVRALAHLTTPTLSYSVEAGIDLLTSLSIEEVRTLHDQLGRILLALDQPPLSH